MSEQISEPTTTTVPVWGRVAYDIGENSSYTAACNGVFPTVEIGGLKRVPVRPAARQLLGDDEIAIAALIKRLQQFLATRSKNSAA